MNIALLLITFINISIAQKSIFNPIHLDMNRTQEISVIQKKIKDAFSMGKNLREDFSSSKEKPSFNGVKIKNIVIVKGKLRSFTTINEISLGLFNLPPNTLISFSLDGSGKVIGIDSDRSKPIIYNGIELKQGVMLKDGSYPSISFSNKFQKYNNKEIYENQPITFDRNGEVKNIDYILHYGKRYYFRELQKSGVIPIEISHSAFNKYGNYARFKYRNTDSFLNNNCNCSYEICEEGDHFYVYRIDQVIDGKDSIQGELAYSKKGSIYFYKNGNSTKPFIDLYDETAPFKVRCSFEPSDDLSPERAESLKNY